MPMLSVPTGRLETLPANALPYPDASHPSRIDQGIMKTTLSLLERRGAEEPGIRGITYYL